MSKNSKPKEAKKLGNKAFLKELRKLQAELCKLQEWVKYKGLRVIIVFEGRDAAGKGGTIKAITERVSPRVFHVVALPAPQTGRNHNCTFSGICSIFHRPAK
jgi:polyphosphate kinase 2 (PPK2 family)